MEIIFVIAAATGRTLVLPPKEPLYRLAADKENKQRGFADFFPLDTPEFAKKVKTITTAEFIRREGGPHGRFPVPEHMRKNVTNSAEVCDKRAKSRSYCGHIADYLNNAYVPDARAADYCIVFDADLHAGKPKTDKIEESIVNFCGERKRYIWTEELNEKVLIHFRAGDKAWRLLAHFYNMVHFTDPALANYFKRFVRDFLHYNDEIYCAAGKIVKALQAEGKRLGFTVDDEGGGGYSAMHIRRGDFQVSLVARAFECVQRG
jgi:GDP-fucose protein O-fucosyltransferase